MGDIENAEASFFTRIGAVAQGSNVRPIKSDEKPPLYALIIGINNYANIASLKGAARDAESFKDYLIKYLSIPETQITTLLNKQATRDNIINAIRALGTDSRIKMQDPIVIFYAGHGTTLDKPEGWETGESHIQALLPQDIKAKDATGKPVVAIPDRTIAALLNELAQAKGDNITVIFDCCHSASGTREPTTEGRFARYVPPEELPPLSADVDQELFQTATQTRHAFVPKGFANQDLRSHVLLAACGS
ncbi:hypothetical protein FRC12_014171 [Ceratobasidium sp. 428]|nr:hypothetical protein FRC12_014171 [Ceratobasidium sp. 428]